MDDRSSYLSDYSAADIIDKTADGHTGSSSPSDSGDVDVDTTPSDSSGSELDTTIQPHQHHRHDDSDTTAAGHTGTDVTFATAGSVPQSHLQDMVGRLFQEFQDHTIQASRAFLSTNNSMNNKHRD